MMRRYKVANTVPMLTEVVMWPGSSAWVVSSSAKSSGSKRSISVWRLHFRHSLTTGNAWLDTYAERYGFWVVMHYGGEQFEKDLSSDKPTLYYSLGGVRVRNHGFIGDASHSAFAVIA